MRLTRGLFLAVLLAASPTAARADDVTIGTTAGTNAWPFSNYYYEGSIATPRYQQIYAASRFSDAVFIDAIRFHNTLGGEITPGSYTLRLSTSPKAVRGVSGLSTALDSNLGTDVQTFYSGALSANSLRISGTPFLYNPMAGNLLLEVLVHSVSERNYTVPGLDVGEVISDTRVAYTVWGYTTTRPDGLVTTFETTPANTVTPEPVSMALLGTGLAGVAGVRRRRRRREEG